MNVPGRMYAFQFSPKLCQFIITLITWHEIGTRNNLQMDNFGRAICTQRGENVHKYLENVKFLKVRGLSPFRMQILLPSLLIYG